MEHKYAELRVPRIYVVCQYSASELTGKIMKLLTSLLFLFCFSLEARTLNEAIIDGNKAYIADVANSAIEVKINTATFESFKRVSDLYGVDVKLYIVKMPIGAVSLPGVIITDTSIDDMTEIQRCFVIAHELSHIKLSHHEQRTALLSRLVPGDIDDAEVKTKMQWVLFHPEAKEQAWHVELEADKAAATVLQKLGYKKEEILSAVQGFKILPATPTHPSTSQRFMNLRRVLELQ
jgi:Zn-dependent protease with chaperone function